MTQASAIEVEVPRGWLEVPLEEVPQQFPLTVELICAAPEVVHDFATNVVVLSDTTVPERVEEWVASALLSLSQEIPGFRLLDQQLWASESFQGALIVGTYIMEATSVTLCRWLLIGQHISATIDATCASVALKEVLPVVADMAKTAKER